MDFIKASKVAIVCGYERNNFLKCQKICLRVKWIKDHFVKQTHEGSFC